MLCSEASVAMSKVHDQVPMSETEKSDLNAHLKVCPACRNFEKSLGGLSSVVQTDDSTTSAKLSEESKDRLSEKLKK